jgi:hypothetical protein
VQAAMNVTVHAAETSRATLIDDYLPRLIRAASEVSADWALWQARPHTELPARDNPARDNPAKDNADLTSSRPARQIGGQVSV